MIYLPPKCLNSDNLSIKVRIMAADTWHFSFLSLPRWGTSSNLITAVHGNLEMFFLIVLYYTASHFASFIQTSSLNPSFGEDIGPPPPPDQTLSVFYYIRLLKGLYTVSSALRGSNAIHLMTTHCPHPAVSELRICLLLLHAHKGIINAY